MSPVPRDVMARMVRKVLDMHDEWDSMHQFVTLHWDGENVTAGTVAIVDPAIHPTEYLEVMAEIAARRIMDAPDDPPCAYLLQIEGWGVAGPPPSASDEERAQFNRDRFGRTFNERADAQEFCQVWCADIHGRLWSATKTRDKPAEVEESLYRPGNAPGGQMIRALLSVAAATGSLAAEAN